MKLYTNYSPILLWNVHTPPSVCISGVPTLAKFALAAHVLLVWLPHPDTPTNSRSVGSRPLILYVIITGSTSAPCSVSSAVSNIHAPAIAYPPPLIHTLWLVVLYFCMKYCRMFDKGMLFWLSRRYGYHDFEQLQIGLVSSCHTSLLEPLQKCHDKKNTLIESFTREPLFIALPGAIVPIIYGVLTWWPQPRVIIPIVYGTLTRWPWLLPIL